MKKEIDFESFLIEKHAKQYEGLDDEMSDDCNDWIGGLGTNEIIDYADEYTKERIEKAEEELKSDMELEALNEPAE